MARSLLDIEEIIDELKTMRDIRDVAIESAAADLDNSDSKNASSLRNFKHVNEIANDTDVCHSCKVIRNGDGDVLAMSHISYHIDDKVVGGEIYRVLRTLLADESVNVTGSTSVENL